MAVAVPSRPSELAARRRPPITVWAAFGALCLAFIAYIWIKWLTGPYATSVRTGPSHEPGWMHAAHLIWEVLSVPAMLATFYWFLVRPWLRERRLSTDGLLCIGFMLLWFQDPLTNFFQPWVTYDSHLVNLGNWTQGIPGWQSFNAPGRQVPEPVLFTPEVYVFLWLFLAMLGTEVMRRAKARFPAWGTLRLLGGAFAVLAVVDLVAEGLVFMPLGFYTYGGGVAPILFGSTYHTFPLHEPICTGLMFTAAAALRYFKDDRGYTIVERGAERISTGRVRGTLRALALIGAAQLCMLIPYTIPVAIIQHTGRAWPQDLRQRSYLTDDLCGAPTGTRCADRSGP